MPTSIPQHQSSDRRVPSKAKATRETVFAACDQLAARGRFPHNRAILEITTGSLSTIAPLRDEWWAQHCATLKSGRIPQGIPEEVASLLIRVWSFAHEQARAQFDDYRLAADSDVAQANQRASDAEAERLVAQRLAEEAHALAEQARREVERSGSVLAERASEHAASLAAISAAHAKEVTLLNERLGEAVQVARDQARRFEGDRRSLLLQIDELRQEAKRLAALNIQAADQVGHRQATIDELRAQIAAQAVSLERTTTQLEDATRRVAELTSDAAVTLERLRESESRVATLSAEIAGNAREAKLVDSLRQMLATAGKGPTPTAKKRQAATRPRPRAPATKKHD